MPMKDSSDSVILYPSAAAESGAAGGAGGSSAPSVPMCSAAEVAVNVASALSGTNADAALVSWKRRPMAC